MSKQEFTINHYSKEEVNALDAAYSKTFDKCFITVGKSIKGRLMNLDGSRALFSTYGKSNVTVPNNSLESEILSNLSIGDTIDILITDYIDTGSVLSIVGSIHEMKRNSVNAFLSNAFNTNMSLVANITSVNNGGFMCSVIVDDVELSLFMPFANSSQSRIENSEEWIGKEIDVMLDKVTKDNKVSWLANHKKFLTTLVPLELSKLTKGGEYSGVITGKTDFGVFVSFNKVLTGMIHKSNLDYVVEDYEVGEEITFFVKDIVKDRLFLTQELKDSLWDSIQVGESMYGKISSIKDFGLMIYLDYETKGLVHKSNLKGKPLDSFKVDDVIFIKILAVNKQNRQITLALD